MLPVIQLGSLAFPVAPFVALLAWYAGMEISARAAARRGLPAERILNAGALAAVLGVLAARVAYIVPRLDGYIQDWPQMFALNLNALDATVGAAVGLLVAFVYLARRLPLAEIADALLPGLALALALIAFGNFLTGEGYGVPARDLPWAVNFLDELRHPAQLYELLADLAIFAFLWFGLSPHRAATTEVVATNARAGATTKAITTGSSTISDDFSRLPGDVFLLGVALLAGARIWLEPFRADSQLIFAGLRGAQVVALAVMVPAALLYMRRHFAMKVERRWVVEVAAVLVIFAGGLMIGYAAGRLNSPQGVTTASNAPGTTNNAPAVSNAALIAATRHFKGDPNALVTFIEFADFQCPYCGKFASDAERKIDDTYTNKGSVRFGFFHLAFLGPESQWAAEASECAGDQGKFWDYHDLLYDRQSGENQGAFTKDKLKQFAVELKLSATGFNACLDSGKYTSQVQNDSGMAINAGFNTTPSFLINGQKSSGSQPFEFYQKLIDSAKNSVR